MADDDRIATTVTQIQRLTRQAHWIRPDGNYEGVHRGGLTEDPQIRGWPQLTDGQKMQAMDRYAGWHGFTDEQKTNLIQNVLAGKPFSHWTESVRAAATPGNFSATPDSAHRAQFQHRDDAQGLDR